MLSMLQRRLYCDGHQGEGLALPATLGKHLSLVCPSAWDDIDEDVFIASQCSPLLEITGTSHGVSLSQPPDL